MLRLTAGDRLRHLYCTPFCPGIQVFFGNCKKSVTKSSSKEKKKQLFRRGKQQSRQGKSAFCPPNKILPLKDEPASHKSVLNLSGELFPQEG